MKKQVISILFTAAVMVFAGRTMRIHTAEGTTDYTVATVDSITFIGGSTAPVGMKLVPAKDSSFQMGSANGEGSELPTHTVSLSKDFWIDSTEVTQKQYNDLMTATYTDYSAPTWSSNFGIGDNFPVYKINWYDAVLYCNARSRVAGKDTVYSYDEITGTPGNDCELTNVVIDYNKNGFRLPTEAEWEYACHAGATTDYYWGDSWDNAYGWYALNSSTKTHEVAGKQPNAFGLYDMSGNVWEWCSDWFGTYSSEEVVDPTGCDTGSERVLRGGGWSSSEFFLRTSGRYFYTPSENDGNIGFRVVCQ